MSADSTDPFARISQVAQDGPSADPGSAGETAEHVAPAPLDAPGVRQEWRGLGQPSQRWAYLDAAGAVLRWTLRFDLPDGKKDFRPLTLWRDGPGQPLSWRLKSEPVPRPLYGLDRLAARPHAQVLLVEGEKTADAAATLFPTFVAMSWPGGAKAIGKADFSPLRGRRVVIWPDADVPGRSAAHAAAIAAMNAGAELATIVDLPKFLPEGWDLANPSEEPWPSAFRLSDAADLLAQAQERSAPSVVEWPPGVRMDPEGLFYDEQRDSGIIPHWLSNPFEILGEARAPDGSGWAVVLRFRDRDGRERTIPILRASLASGGGDARSVLADAGLVFDTGRGKADRLTAALMRVKSSRRITLVGATGWSGDRFVLPGQTFGSSAGERVLFTGEARSLNYGAAGTFAGWRDGVAAMACDNSALTFAISAAFAGPLLRPLGAEGGGFHFRGNSSTGKSTLLIAAGSVWGGSSGEHGFGHTWRATANALESLALAHNDLLLCLDEFAQVDPAEAGVAAYALSNGQGKARLKPNGDPRRQHEWLLLFLSSGEKTLADHMTSTGKVGAPAAGQELRLVDVAAEAGKGMGIWEYLHDAPGPAQLSEGVKAAAKAHYGLAGPLFLERLTGDRGAVLTNAREYVRAFLSQAVSDDDTGQVRRVARRFALAAAAGELATSWGLVPWPDGAAAEAALALFRRWADGFGRDTPREEREVLKRLRDTIQSQKSAFSPVADHDVEPDSEPTTGGRDGEARQMRTLGFRHVSGGQVRYLFHDAGWAEVFRGMDQTEAARIVQRSGYLETDGGEKRLKKRQRIRGEFQRFYCVKNSILEAPLGN